uniref:Uncharacterized protein n=1 Tax=Parascaris equorum TaxID=6256 RepID=A0A914RDW4_PAREQ
MVGDEDETQIRYVVIGEEDELSVQNVSSFSQPLEVTSQSLQDPEYGSLSITHCPGYQNVILNASPPHWLCETTEDEVQATSTHYIPLSKFCFLFYVIVLIATNWVHFHFYSLRPSI